MLRNQKVSTRLYRNAKYVKNLKDFKWFELNDENLNLIIFRNQDGHDLQTEDCVNGTWFPNDFNGGSTNYSFLTAELARRREIEKYREETISYEPDITIFNKTKYVWLTR